MVKISYPQKLDPLKVCCYNNIYNVYHANVLDTGLHTFVFAQFDT